jgi:hypothetical protein
MVALQPSENVQKLPTQNDRISLRRPAHGHPRADPALGRCGPKGDVGIS